MKHQSYDWLLVGCHLITEVAVAYYSHYAHNSSAVKSFRRVIKENSKLSQELSDAGYTVKTTHLCPMQISIIVRHLGLPDYVDGMIRENSYLAVPKVYKKI